MRCPVRELQQGLGMLLWLPAAQVTSLLSCCCCQVGIALKPATPAELVLPYLEQGLLDLVGETKHTRVRVFAGGVLAASACVSLFRALVWCAGVAAAGHSMHANRSLTPPTRLHCRTPIHGM
jgi:hypothetical protein